MGNTNRLVGYLASAASASLFYVVWSAVAFEFGPPPHASIVFNIGLAIFFWFAEGMWAALGLMAVPWYLAVRGYGRLQCSGPVYYGLIGAATVLVVGSGASSLSPKPLFIEDQTFREGFMIAADRQGVCLLLTGLVFGLTFWLVSERLRRSRPLTAS